MSLTKRIDYWIGVFQLLKRCISENKVESMRSFTLEQIKEMKTLVDLI